MKELSSYYYIKSQENPPEKYSDIGYFEPKIQTMNLLRYMQIKPLILENVSFVCLKGMRYGGTYE